MPTRGLNVHARIMYTHCITVIFTESDSGMSGAAIDNPVSSINVIVSWIATIGVTSYIHGPSINGHLHYSHYLTIHGPFMDVPCLPPSVKLSMDAAVTVPSMDHP